jgi:hypothetical protein
MLLNVNEYIFLAVYFVCILFGDFVQRGQTPLLSTSG